MLDALLKLLHLLAVVVWVGGMCFAHFCLRPSLALLEPPQRLALMHAVLGRFFAAVLVAAPLTLATGLWMMGRVAARAAQAASPGGGLSMPPSWTLMAALGVLMIAIFGHIRFVLYRRLGAAVEARDGPRGGAALAQIRQWVTVNLVLGLAVIAVAVLRWPG